MPSRSARAIHRSNCKLYYLTSTYSVTFKGFPLRRSPFLSQRHLQPILHNPRQSIEHFRVSNTAAILDSTIVLLPGARGGAVCWGTALQGVRSRILFPMVSLEIFHWQYFLPHLYGPLVDSASYRNEYQEYFLGGKDGRCVGLTTLPPSRVEYLEIWEPQPAGNLRACPGLYRDCFTFTFYAVTLNSLCWKENQEFFNLKTGFIIWMLVKWVGHGTGTRVGRHFIVQASRKGPFFKKKYWFIALRYTNVHMIFFPLKTVPDSSLHETSGLT